MKEKQVFFNPFRLISPKLNAEASRLKEPPPPEMTCLEEGLLVMCSKLVEMAELIYKTLIIADKKKVERCQALGSEIHEEEKGLTGDLVCSPTTTGNVLKTVLLFPGRLERVGDLMESMVNVAQVKARDGIPFSDKANSELSKLFSLLIEVLKNFRDVLSTRNRALLVHLVDQEKTLAQMTVDFALSHEERLIEGVCSPKASSLYLDILDSVKGVTRHLNEMCDSLMKLEATQESASTN